MHTLKTILENKTASLKETLANLIISQNAELRSAKEAVINQLLGVTSNYRFGLREQFTYLSKIDSTLAAMLQVYEELFGVSFKDDQEILKFVDSEGHLVVARDQSNESSIEL